MPEETETVETHEVETPIQKEGSVQFMTKAAFGNSAPLPLKRILSAIRYTCVGGITMVAGTDLLSGWQAKVVTFCLGVVILILGGVEVATGVAPEKKED